MKEKKKQNRIKILCTRRLINPLPVVHFLILTLPRHYCGYCHRLTHFTHWKCIKSRKELKKEKHTNGDENEKIKCKQYNMSS